MEKFKPTEHNNECLGVNTKLHQGCIKAEEIARIESMIDKKLINKKIKTTSSQQK